MTGILQEIERQYQARAALAQVKAVVVKQQALKRKATRTYTGAALERRRSWGRSWGAIVREHAKELA